MILQQEQSMIEAENLKETVKALHARIVAIRDSL